MARNRRRVCGIPGCPTITDQPRCATHQQQYGTTTGTTTQRGYGWRHRQTRKAWQPAVDTGQTPCARCGELIEPGQPWHPDHSDTDASQYLGPSHATCNITAPNYRTY